MAEGNESRPYYIYNHPVILNIDSLNTDITDILESYQNKTVVMGFIPYGSATWKPNTDSFYFEAFISSANYKKIVMRSASFQNNLFYEKSKIAGTWTAWDVYSLN